MVTRSHQSLRQPFAARAPCHCPAGPRASPAPGEACLRVVLRGPSQDLKYIWRTLLETGLVLETTGCSRGPELGEG